MSSKLKSLKLKLELKELFAKDKELDAKIMEILNSDD